MDYFERFLNMKGYWKTPSYGKTQIFYLLISQNNTNIACNVAVSRLVEHFPKEMNSVYRFSINLFDCCSVKLSIT